jgi:RimJ/RimL family protein N-acetyltransferase
VFDAQPHLVGELVELRPLREDDFAALAGAASDPLIWEQHPADRHRIDVFRAFFADHLASGGALVVLDRRTGAVIGTSRYRAYDPDRSEVEIGYTFLARAYWGGATNRELKALMLAHAFRFVETVVFLIHPDNGRSQRSVEKLGAVRIGERPDGGGNPSYAYALTRSAARSAGGCCPDPAG